MKFNEKLIIQQYLSGLNTKEIATLHNTYNTSIRRVLLRNNIPIRISIEARRTHDNPFKENEEYSEYFIGLLLTDGTIVKSDKSYQIRLELKDEDLVIKFRDWFCPNNKVSKILHKKFNCYTYSTGMKNYLVGSYLEDKFNFYNKSLNAELYISITPHILRGIFDGNGYWHKTNKGNTLSWGICGASKKLIDQIYNYLLDNNIKPYIRKEDKYPRKHPIYYIEIYKQLDVAKIANLMYSNSHIYLQRKYDTGYSFGENLKKKLSKFKEGDGNSNLEPSLNSIGKRINSKTGQYILEGAETIMAHLSYLDNKVKE